MPWWGWLVLIAAGTPFAFALIYPFLVAASRADDDMDRMRDERLNDE